MTATAVRQLVPHRWRARPSGKLLRTVALALCVGTLVVGARLELVHTHHAAVPTFSSGPAVPTSPTIEQGWGIKITGVELLADGGLVAVRYQVVDSAKDGRLHDGTENIPTILDEQTGRVIRSTAALMHVHYADGGEDGRSYSILYGNSGGALHRGSLVTVRMSDGLVLRHVTVVN